MTSTCGACCARFCNVVRPFVGAMFAISISMSAPATAQLVIDGTTYVYFDESDRIYRDIFVYDSGAVGILAARPFPRAEFFDSSYLGVNAADGITDGMIVSFADDSDFARMVGYRVEQLHDYVPDGDANPVTKSGNIPLEVMKEILRIQSNTTDFNYDRVLR